MSVASNDPNEYGSGNEAGTNIEMNATGTASNSVNQSKKQMVKRKWNQLKKTVKSHRLHHQRRHSEDSTYEGYDEDYDEGYDIKNDVEENPQLPVISSNDGFYWIGKDYANTYNADFKDIADFSSDQFDREETPRHFLFFFFFNKYIFIKYVFLFVECLGAMKLWYYLVIVPEIWLVTLFRFILIIFSNFFYK
jgi:hypothetical protein